MPNNLKIDDFLTFDKGAFGKVSFIDIPINAEKLYGDGSTHVTNYGETEKLKFQKQFKKLGDSFLTWALERTELPFFGEEKYRHTNAIFNNISKLERSMFNESNTKDQPDAYFEKIKHMLETIRTWLDIESIDITYRIKQLSLLANHFTSSGPHLYQHIYDCYYQIRLQDTIENWCADIRKQIIHEFAKQDRLTDEEIIYMQYAFQKDAAEQG